MTRKLISFFLSALLVLSCAVIMTPVVVYAEDDDYGSSASGDGDVPDDAFDGDYAEYKGRDGSTTTVFDNGSVITTYADGSKEGVDYKGNQHVGSKDGTYTVRTTDGTTATEYPDGTRTMTEPDGKKTTVFNDGHMTQEYTSLGLTVEYNSDGETTSLGFIGGDERIGYDENGRLKNGTITGPNGARLDSSDDSLRIQTPNGKKVDYEDTGNTEKWSISAPDGSSITNTITTSYTQDENGNWVRKESSDGVMVGPDGARFDSNFTVTYDENGDPQAINNYVGQWTNPDGSWLWMDGNSHGVEYHDPNNGDSFIMDSNGNLLEMKSSGEIDFKATYDDDGNLTGANVTYGDGGRMTVDADGTAWVTLPDGTEYKSDRDGNVWENGKQIKQNGAWLSDPNAAYGADADKITSADLVGYWTINGTLSDMESPLVGALKSFFDGLFGEGAGGDIVDSHIDGTQDVTLNAYIEDDGSGYRITIRADDVTMVYSGTLKNDTL